MAGTSRGNPDLEPQRAQTLEASFEYLAGSLSVRTSAFRSRVTDVVKLVPPTDPDLIQQGMQKVYANVGTIDSWGVTSELKSLHGPWDVYGNVSYQHSTDRDTDSRTTRVPDVTANAGLNWHASDRLNVDAETHYVGERISPKSATLTYDVPISNYEEYRVDSYVLTDLTLSGRLRRSAHLGETRYTLGLRTSLMRTTPRLGTRFVASTCHGPAGASSSGSIMCFDPRSRGSTANPKLPRNLAVIFRGSMPFVPAVAGALRCLSVRRKRRCAGKKLMRQGLIALSLALSWCVGGHSWAAAPGEMLGQRPLVVDRWRVEDGLPQNSVNAIVQSRDGYLWLATYDGLARFDGVRFKIFRHQPVDTLGSSRLLWLTEDVAGDLWILTEGRDVITYRDGVFVLPGSVHWSKRFVQGIFPTSDGSTWIVTNRELNRFKDGAISSTINVGPWGGAGVTSISTDREGSAWIGTQNGLARLTGEGLTFYTTAEGLPSNDITSIFSDGQAEVWVGTTGGLAGWEGGRFRRYTTAEGLPANAIRSIRRDNGANLWVTTAGGELACLRGERFEPHSLGAARSMSSGTTVVDRLSDVRHTLTRGLDGALWLLGDTCLAQIKDGIVTWFELPGDLDRASIASISGDREGDLWIGTHRGGLLRLRPARLSVLTADEGLRAEEILSVLASRDGSVWIGTNGGGLARLKDGVMTTYTREDGLLNNYVWSLAEDHEGRLWVGTWDGLARMDGERCLPLTDSNGRSIGTVLALYEDSRGILWIGTTEGLKFLKDGRVNRLTTSDGLLNNSVRAILEDKRGAIWLATDGGVSCLRQGKFTSYTTRDGLPDNFIRSIHEDRDGSLWFGTYGNGLARLKNGKFAAITPKQGLFDHTASQILADDRGDFWMTGNKGIYRAARRELNAVADGTLAAVSCVAYGKADGMKEAECNGGSQPAGCKTADGRLWFPTAAGVAVIDLATIGENRIPPNVRIEEVVVDDQPLDVRSRHRLGPEVRRLHLAFTALSFVNPANVRFKCMLEGFDHRWVDAGTDREATYTNLRSGSYRFRVIACNNDGVWNTEGASFAFVVRPFYYQTTTFYIVSVLLILGLVAAVQYEIVHRLRARAAVLAERNRIAREIHDTVGQGLSGVVLQLESGELWLATDSAEARARFVRARDLARECLEETCRAISALRPAPLERAGLPEAIRALGESLTFGTGTELTLVVTGRVRALADSIEQDLWRIAQEALTNAVRHAKAGAIRVRLHYRWASMDLSVKDDGIGCEAVNVVSSSGFGLRGMRERAAARGWRLTVASRPAKGTEVSLTVPMRPRLVGGRW